MDNGEATPPAAEPKNNSEIKDGIMTVTLYLEGEAGLAKALGALELSKDLIKQYCLERAMREARTKSQIIRPGLVN